MKKILLISNSDSEGSGTSFYTFFNLLRSRGYLVNFLVRNKKNHNNDIVKINRDIRYKYLKLLRKIEDLIGVFKKEYCFHDRGRYLITDINQINLYIKTPPDIIIFGWLSEFIDPKVIIK